MFKDLITKGLTVMSQGYTDFDSWSEKMIKECGRTPSVLPFLIDIFHWSLLMTEKQSGSFAIKTNCWEFKQCNMENPPPRGRQARVCPAVTEKRLDGIHRGFNGGRACWTLDGTLCNGKKQLNHRTKQNMCRTCDFYHAVVREEGHDAIFPVSFIRNCVLEE